MDENRFSASVLPKKEYYKDFGRIHMKKSKLSIVFLIMGIIFYAADFCLTAFTGMEWETYMVTAAYLLIFYWLFMGDFIGRSNYRGINKKCKGAAQTYYFGESSFSVNSEWENSNVRYGVLDDLYESGMIFALYINKTSAHIIPKSAFKEGTPVQFRQFLEEKTGKKVKRVHTEDKTALKIVAAILIFAVMMGGIFLAAAIARNHEPVSMPFTHKEYTITLPGDFEEEDQEGFYFTVTRDDAAVFVGKDERSEMEELYGGEVDMAAYMPILLENAGLSAEDANYLPDGTADFSYTSEVDGEEYFYYVLVKESKEAFWINTFVCLEEDTDDYIDRFFTWSDTIKIKE